MGATIMSFELAFAILSFVSLCAFSASVMVCAYQPGERR